jgi:hypothetical protein
MKIAMHNMPVMLETLGILELVQGNPLKVICMEINIKELNALLRVQKCIQILRIQE